MQRKSLSNTLARLIDELPQHRYREQDGLTEFIVALIITIRSHSKLGFKMAGSTLLCVLACLETLWSIVV